MIPGQIQQILAGQGDPAVLQQALQSNLIAPQQVQDQPAQADIETPDQSQSDTPPSGGASMGAQMEAKKPGFLSRLFGNANKAADSDPQAASKPGGWAKALVAGVSGAAQGVMHDFSDAQGDAPGLQRLAQVAGNRTARIQAQAQLQRKNKQEDVENDDKHQQAQALLAHTKIQQLYTERLVHNLDEESLDKSIAAGQKEIDQTTTGEFGAPVYEKDVTSDEYNRFLQDKKNSDPDSRVEDFHAVPSGKIADPKQPTGYRTLYTIVGTPKTQKLTQDFVDSVNPGLPDAQKLKAGDNEIPGAYAQWLRQQSNNNRTTQDAIKLTREKSDLDEMTTEQKLDQARAMKSMGNDWTTALGTTHNDPFAALQQVQAMKNADGTSKYPKVAQTAMDIYGGPKEWETMRKDQANEKVKQQEANANDEKAKADLIKANAAETKAGATATKQHALGLDNPDIDNLTPEQYRATLPLGTQQTFKAVHEGRDKALRLQGRAGELTDAGQAFHIAYPDADIPKAEKFGKVRQDFEAGKIADTITGFGTGMKHAKLMFDNTGPASYIPGTKENSNYHQDAHYLAVEVARALNPNGVPTEGQIKEHYDDLTTGNPFTRKQKLMNAMDIVGSKYTELNQRWENALPDPQNFHPDMPGISQEAKDNYAYVKNEGKVDPETQARMQQQNAQHATLEKTGQQVPTGAASAKANLPPQAVKQLKAGQNTTFGNGQVWTLDANGQPIQIPTPQGK